MELTIYISVAVIFAVIALIKVIQLSELKEQTKQLNRDLKIQKVQSNLLKNELQENKLENLKFTLNPHSFRNTLNAIEHVAKSTLRSVENLSEILDFMLYDSEERYVSIEKEIVFAQKYFDLYKLKLIPTVNAKFHIDEKIGDNLDRGIRIAPMITAHFVENAFKHGDLEGDDAFIDLKMELVEPNSIVYSVRNKIKTINIRKSKGGLGTGKFNERLLLLYPNKHHLDAKVEGGIYSANLKIEFI
jgi:LytS/YehU family sensor histidine kinase